MFLKHSQRRIFFILTLAALTAVGSALPRASTGGVLIGNKIYLHGGYSSFIAAKPALPINDMVILPIDEPFNVSNPPYEDTLSIVGGPSISGQACFEGGWNNTGLYVFGGRVISNNGGIASTNTLVEANALFVFNTTTLEWGNSSLTVNGAAPAARDSASASTVISTGTAYIFGGEPSPGAPWTYNVTWQYHDGSWSSLGSPPGHIGRQAHSSVMLNNGKMVILGGANTYGIFVPMSIVAAYNTMSGEWENTTVSNAPATRISHSAIATNDNKVVIFGGDTGTGFLNDVAVLDMSTTTYSWSVPRQSGTPPSARCSHTAILVGTQMFIMYGQTNKTTLDGNIYVLDTTIWEWKSTYIPTDLNLTYTGNVAPINRNPSPSPPPSTLSRNGPPIGAIAGGAVGGAICLVACVVILFFIRRRRNRQHNAQFIDKDGGFPTGNMMYDAVPPYSPHQESHGKQSYSVQHESFSTNSHSAYAQAPMTPDHQNNVTDGTTSQDEISSAVANTSMSSDTRLSSQPIIYLKPDVNE